MMAEPKIGVITQTSATPGESLECILPNQAGAYIVNPLDAADQGLPTAAMLYVDQVGPAQTEAHRTTIGLAPGQAYTVIPFTISGVHVASRSANHRFTAVMWEEV